MARLSVLIKGELEQVKKKARWVAQQSILDVLEHAQRTQPSITLSGTFEVGKIPVLTSELVNSLSVDGGGIGSGAYVAPIASYQLGDTISFRWTAPHAPHIEYGFTSRAGKKVPGRYYVTTAVDRFIEFARKRAKEVQ